MTATLPVVRHSDREANALVLVLHAFDNAPADMDSIGATVKALRPASHVVIPRLPLRRAARVNPLDVARSLLDLIEDQIAFRNEKQWPEFDEILLIGHSMGALLARKVYITSRADENVTDVVFVMHGIRDTGYWTQKVARKVEEVGGNPPKIYASETSSYGYFAMLSFLLPSERHKKVRWLMDQYVEARSLYPNARFAYVGHSNGTYLVAKALLDYPSCSFDRIVFAGSVVRTDYDWGRHIARGKVEAVLNYVATADVIVAVLPGAWEMVNLQDLGSAGHNGFRIPHEKVFQTKFVRGGHSCAREEDNWNDIAEFIVSPAPGPTKSPLVEQNQNWLVVKMGHTAPFWWLVIVAILSGLGWMAVRIGDYFHHPVIFLFIYLWLLWQVVSKL